MVKLLRKIALPILGICLTFNVSSQKLGFAEVLAENPDTPTTFCVPNNIQNTDLLHKENIAIKYAGGDWLFITTTPQWINEHKSNGSLTDFYFEFAPPALMGDSARFFHFVDPVLEGIGGLQRAYTGKDVIIGVVDTGVDFNHPDLQDANGNTRVLRYWDHTVATGPAPMPYNYGTVWDSAAINNGTCTSLDNHSHGTTVVGQAAGNAAANGTNKGVAPEADIIMVESNFNASNWTLTIADACDYIFKVADSLGKPAIVNLSLGTYLGSHDGNDPASIAIEQMLDAKNGRLVVAAAGNSGFQLPYHVRNDITADTSFTWLVNNPAGSFGPNTIFFDLWSDVSEATFDFGFAADQITPSYSLRGSTAFYGATSSLGTVILDTIWSGSNRIATLQVYTEIVSGNYNMQVLFTAVDSTAYRYRFMTTGSGSYDLWSGQWLGFNNLETNLPTAVEMPAIVNYVLPDTLQSIVSSWNCSEKVISVANMGNRNAYQRCNGTQYNTNPPVTPGKISGSSSKGPNRHNLIKPDIAAAGEVSLTTSPMWMVNNPAVYCSVLDTGGFHGRNGGTSIAAPVISGIAALYFEHCSNASYMDFFNDLTATAYTDGFTGTVPNNECGYGKAHALDLMLSTEYVANITGPAGICEDSIDLSITTSATLGSVLWSDGFNGLVNTVFTPDNYSASIVDVRSCPAETDTLSVVQFAVPTITPITIGVNQLSVIASDSYQWTLNGIDLPGETNPTLIIAPPYGVYTCYTVSPDGCKVESDAVQFGVGISENIAQNVTLFPNPTDEYFKISSEDEVINVSLISADGRVIPVAITNGNQVDMSKISRGLYQVIVVTSRGTLITKISRM